MSVMMNEWDDKAQATTADPRIRELKREIARVGMVGQGLPANSPTPMSDIQREINRLAKIIDGQPQLLDRMGSEVDQLRSRLATVLVNHGKGLDQAELSRDETQRVGGELKEPAPSTQLGEGIHQLSMSLNRHSRVMCDIIASLQSLRNEVDL